MTTVTVDDVMAAAETLSLEDRRELNRRLVDNLRDVRDQEARKAAAVLRVGDVVEFTPPKSYSPVKGRIVGFGTKHVKVDAYYDKYGIHSQFVTHWTCPAVQLKKVDGPAPGPRAGAQGRETFTLTKKDIGTLAVGPDGKLVIK